MEAGGGGGRGIAGNQVSEAFPSALTKANSVLFT